MVSSRTTDLNALFIGISCINCVQCLFTLIYFKSLHTGPVIHISSSNIILLGRKLTSLSTRPKTPTNKQTTKNIICFDATVGESEGAGPPSPKPSKSTERWLPPLFRTSKLMGKHLHGLHFIRTKSSRVHFTRLNSSHVSDPAARVSPGPRIDRLPQGRCVYEEGGGGRRASHYGSDGAQVKSPGPWEGAGSSGEQMRGVCVTWPC